MAGASTDDFLYLPSGSASSSDKNLAAVEHSNVQYARLLQELNTFLRLERFVDITNAPP